MDPDPEHRGLDRAEQPSASVPRASARIADELRRRIVSGRLAAGFPLPSERELIEEFGVSRPTLREALRVLDSESLIDIKRGSHGGAVVSVPGVHTAAGYLGVILEYRHATIDDVFGAACVLEANCAAMLARSRTEEDLTLLRAAVETERQHRDDPAALLDAQNDFHRLLIDLVGNTTLAVLIGQLREVIDAATRSQLVESALSEEQRLVASAKGVRAHAKLVDLIEQRDADGAAQLRRRQVSATGAYLKESGVGESVLDLLG
ncbi:GntR family transcriptional regulator [Gordonia sp. VNQ95]|uniref:FadR/GntR family transcriptional regulator n=1 Tax=Gordonia TaxID=2053 RepID=UPI0032B39ADC